MQRAKPRTEKRASGTTCRPAPGPEYLMRLYVTGTTPRSVRAIKNLKRICEEHLRGRYTLEVIDIYQQPVLAKGEQIIAVPTLIKRLPTPLRRFVGDMSDVDKVLLGLDVRPKG
jgi:circadian clock protein KaiB